MVNKILLNVNWTRHNKITLDFHPFNMNRKEIQRKHSKPAVVFLLIFAMLCLATHYLHVGENLFRYCETCD